MLSPYRVLDLTDERGLLCGQILGDLGADVIQVEPPAGSPARRLGPFYGDEPLPEHSLFWWSYTRNKRSLTLDLDTPEGQATLRRLARSAHFLIESDKPGALARRGLGYADLAALNPALIYVSISAFGSSGPKAHYADSDLVVLAAGGPLALGGDDDRPPLRISVPQAYLHVGAEAAMAALIAHHERAQSGLGQHIDASAQQAIAAATQSTILSSAVGFVPAQRLAGGVRLGPLVSRLVYPARDGFVSITFLFGSSIGPATRRLMAYIHEQGGCDAATRDKDWIGFMELLFTGKESFAEYDRVKQIVADFTRTKTKAELLQAALERGLLIAPVATTKEVLESPQLAAREYFQPLRHPELDRVIRYPGPFAKFSATPIVYRRRPPRIGEHTAEILAELARSAEPANGAHLPRPQAAPGNALAGLKVLDLMWAIAGPAATRVLADYGATVVRVESHTRVDVCRTLPPFLNAQLGPENAALFHNMNAGKLMLTLDLAKPAARTVILDLVRWADVVTESFSPKVMSAWGLDYTALRAVKPDLIMLSTCLMGQTGPLASFAGFGNLAAAITGFYELCGWPDRPPAGPFGAYTDYMAPRFNAIAILAALEYRRRTGRGQYIDLSQAEAALHFLSPAFLDYVANGRVWSPTGNRDLTDAPHGVYPSAGEDCWVAIAVATDGQWKALCAVIGHPELLHDARFATADGRRAHASDLDAVIARWTTTLDMHAAEAALQQHGVPASAVLNSPELCADPQLRHRGHFATLSHPEQGTTCVEGSRFRLSRTPARIAGSAPTLGRDNQYVLEQLLGYSEERITELAIAGLLD
jgi:crotonobetainyl-CoA:carnitine CoA-transferase CaiB-like acyl-CoA transferase